MIFFLGDLCQNHVGITGSCSAFSNRQRRPPTYVKVVPSVSNRRTGDRNVSVLMENAVEEAREVPSIDGGPKTTVGGGVQDVYNEDSVTEDLPVTPWSVSIARYYYHLLFFI